jgi:hypothetical protein
MLLRKRRNFSENWLNQFLTLISFGIMKIICVHMSNQSLSNFLLFVINRIFNTCQLVTPFQQHCRNLYLRKISTYHIYYDLFQVTTKSRVKCLKIGTPMFVYVWVWTVSLSNIPHHPRKGKLKKGRHSYDKNKVR